MPQPPRNVRGGEPAAQCAGSFHVPDSVAMFKFSLLFSCVCLCGSASVAGVVEVYVSIPPQKYLVEQIGGEHVKARALMAPGQIPETFSPTPRQLAALSRADVYFRVNAPLEKNWLASIRAANEALRIIACCESLPEGAVAEELAGDFHLWTDPNHARRMAKRIEQTLAELDPARAPTYAANFQRLQATLKALDRFIRESLAPRRTSHFIVAHPSWGHYAKAYGLTQLAVESPSGHVGPGALGALIATAKREGVRTVFAQQDMDPSIIQSLADEIGAELSSLNPLAEDYVNNLMETTIKIAKALR